MEEKIVKVYARRSGGENVIPRVAKRMSKFVVSDARY